MNKIIEWLLQNTPDGATYLQVIILSGILIFALSKLFAMIKDVFYILKEGEEEDGEIDS